MEGNSRTGMPFSGRREMQALALSAQEALERAGLIDEVRALHQRVLTRAPDELMEAVDDGGDGADGRSERWGFKPMVELLFREVRDVASRQDRSLEDRRHEIAWLLDISGF